MATSSLGKLTLDLAVKLSEFTDGMSKAERETKAKTEAMNKSVKDFKSNLLDSLDGTAVGSAFSNLNSNLKGVGSVAGVAGLAIGSVGVAATTAMAGLAKLAIDTAKADAEMAKMAQTAGTSVENFQTLTYASKQYGISQEQLSSILADVQEKLGEFTSTGGGGAADFFDQLKVRTGQTDDAMQKFAQTLQGKDGIDAIRAIKEQMDEWGITSQEQRFILESLASDLGNLQPVLSMTASEWDDYGRSLEDAGIVKSQEAIDKSIELERQTRMLSDTYEGIKNKLASAVIPVMADLAEQMLGATTQTDDLKGSLLGVDPVIDGIKDSIIGASTEARLWAIDMKALTFQLGNFKSFLYELGTTTSFSDMYDTYKKYEKISREQNEKDLAIRNQIWQEGQILKAGLSPASIRQAVSNKGLILSPGDVLGGGTNFGPVNQPSYGPYAPGYTSSQSTTAQAQEIKTTKQLADEAERKAKAEEKSAKTKKENASLIPKAAADAILAGAKRLGVDPNDLAAVISFETSGTFSTNARNPTSSATGLIQFMEGSDGVKDGKYYGHTRDQFGSMLPLQQMDYVVKYLEGRGIGPGSGLAEIYDAVAGYGYKKGTKAYNANKVWDVNKDGVVAKGEAVTGSKFKQHIRPYFEDGDAIAQSNIAAQLEQQARANEQAAAEAKRLQEQMAKEREAIIVAQMEKEEKLRYEHEQKQAKIEQLFGVNSEQYLKEQYRYEKQLSDMRIADAQEYINQLLKVESIRATIREGTQSATAKVQDLQAQASMSDADYQRYSLNNQYGQAVTGANSSYQNTVSAINKQDINGNYDIASAGARYELLKEAKEEHEAEMYAIDLEYAEKRKQTEQEIMAAKLDLYATTTSSMSGLLSAFFGENTRIQRAMFAMEKGFTLARIYLDNEEALSKAWASAAFPYNIPAVTKAAFETGALASAASAITPVFTGIAHGGLDYVPKESTYLLDKGERVLSPNQNKDLTEFMSKSSGNVNITVNVDAQGNSQIDAQNASQMSKQLASTIKAVVVDTLHKERRQGGILYGA